MKKSTMADVAKLAGISKSTVSQYINNRFTYMSEPTKERIKNAIEELQYVPNFTAKSLKQKKTRTIGVIVANILHSFTTEVIRAIEDECERNNFQLIVCNADDNSAKERKYIDILLAKQVDGLIIFPTTGNFDYYQYLKELQFPVVFIDRKVDGNIYPTFLLDNDAAAEIAVESFYQNGIQEAGIVLPPLKKNMTPREERLEGFRKALARRGIQLKEDWIVEGNSQKVSEHLKTLYRNNDLPKGFFTVNDVSLIELLKFLKSKRLKIPRDINVITIDFSVYLDLLNPPITIIKQPTVEIGVEAASCLLKEIQEEERKQEYELRRFTPVTHIESEQIKK
ncbi:substrate-binding domain-containing protein [Oceanobacillus jordanicus]|uniref:Substrate-binding domain-containing protein n=1 Tax=Oceanobacillus jordanicus TaxID=2867266 RepID=A0AAW5B1T0_9BACI|nr:substrate-binding domain-containing protein [Oceanobacillus jordanicus]MCG3418252.1 substrate-binding domain-containing protein [Oceanobacillus jordanicus]